MLLVVVAMRGNIWRSILICITTLLILSACINHTGNLSKTIKKEPTQFKQEPTLNLLDRSKVLSYSNNFYFVPTFLGNDQFVYGYSLDEQNQKSSLIALDTTNNHYSLIKSIDFKDAPVTFGTYYADESYVVFNEYHYAEQESKYFLWSKQDDHYLEILNIPNVPPLHFTEINRWKNTLIIITSDAAGNYPIIHYNMDSKQSTIIESNNSGFPVVIDHNLYYLLLDNEQIKTSLMSYHLISLEKRVLSETIGKDNAFYSGLYLFDNRLLTVKQTEKRMTFYEGYPPSDKELLHFEYAAKHFCHQDFLAFLGNNRTSQDGRLQYYL